MSWTAVTTEVQQYEVGSLGPRLRYKWDGYQ